MTAVSGATFAASEFNTYVRDNLNETAPAKATAAGQLFVSTGTNAIAARTPDTSNVNTSQTTASTTYTDLATVGPTVTATTGTSALVFISSTMNTSSSGQNVYTSYAVSGASSVTATDDRAVLLQAAAANQAIRATHAYLETGLTAGSNTFTAKYRVTGGTGTYSNRRIAVLPL